jgi:hypothetical protein
MLGIVLWTQVSLREMISAGAAAQRLLLRASDSGMLDGM